LLATALLFASDFLGAPAAGLSVAGVIGDGFSLVDGLSIADGFSGASDFSGAGEEGEGVLAIGGAGGATGAGDGVISGFPSDVVFGAG